MMFLKELKKHARNIKVFRAYSSLELLKQAVLFPVDYYLKNGTSNYPLNIALFVTSRCNARCLMCNLKDILNEKEGKEPSLDEIDKFLSSIKGGKPSIILFGGEPFVRKDITDIVAIVKKHGFRSGLFTNGILLNKEIADKLISLNMDFIAFSLQGTKDVHDKILGVKGAYEKLLENMEFFTGAKSNTKVIMHTTITEENLEHLTHLAMLGKEKKVDLIRFGHPTFFTSSDVEKNTEVCRRVFPEGGMSQMGFNYDPEGKSEKYYNAVKEIKEKFGSSVTFTPDLSLSEVKNWYSPDFKTKRKCFFLWRGLFIYPNGDVYPCESLKYPIGNIYKEPFSAIWNNKKYVKLRRIIKRGLLPACARCCKL